MRSLLFIVVSWFSLSTHALAQSWTEIAICDDIAEVPPLIYFERVDNEKTENIVGVSVSIIKAIFERNQIPFHISLIPWSRCLREAKDGQQYQMILNAVRTPEREKDFHYITTHCIASKFYFYSKARYPNGLSIRSPEDLERYSIGGVRGYDHTVFGIDNSDVDHYTGSAAQLVNMLYKDRFDLFLSSYPIIPWLIQTQPQLKVTERLGYQQLPGLPGTAFHMLVSKKFDKAAELTQLLNLEINAMQRSGEMMRLLDSTCSVGS